MSVSKHMRTVFGQHCHGGVFSYLTDLTPATDLAPANPKRYKKPLLFLSWTGDRSSKLWCLRIRLGNRQVGLGVKVWEQPFLSLWLLLLLALTSCRQHDQRAWKTRSRSIAYFNCIPSWYQDDPKIIRSSLHCVPSYSTGPIPFHFYSIPYYQHNITFFQQLIGLNFSSTNW